MPIIWQKINRGTFAKLIPANVSDNDRAIVTAGFAKLVDAVNQYAEVIYNPTRVGMDFFWNFRPLNITSINPNVAIASEKPCDSPERDFEDIWAIGRSNIRWAAQTPKIAPKICTHMYIMLSRFDISPLIRKEIVTIGLKWAPEIGPKIVIITNKIAPVAMVLPNKAIAVFSGDKVSPIMPEPITVANSINVPKNSDK